MSKLRLLPGEFDFRIHAKLYLEVRSIRIFNPLIVLYECLIYADIGNISKIPLCDGCLDAAGAIKHLGIYIGLHYPAVVKPFRNGLAGTLDH